MERTTLHLRAQYRIYQHLGSRCVQLMESPFCWPWPFQCEGHISSAKPHLQGEKKRLLVEKMRLIRAACFPQLQINDSDVGFGLLRDITEGRVTLNHACPLIWRNILHFVLWFICVFPLTFMWVFSLCLWLQIWIYKKTHVNTYDAGEKEAAADNMIMIVLVSYCCCNKIPQI